MTGRWYYAVPTNRAARPFRTPMAAMLYLERNRLEGDIYTSEGTGPRALLGHRSPEGRWDSAA